MQPVPRRPRRRLRDMGPGVVFVPLYTIILIIFVVVMVTNR